MQMNTCLSGLAGCFARTQYPAVVDEAIQRIRANDALASSADAPYVAQNGVEERRWICVTTTEQVNVCTSHLTTAGTDAGTANTAQCVELTAVLQRFANDGTTIFAGDVNRLDSCAPDTFWNETDAAATQARGIQHVYGTARSFKKPVAEIEPATYTGHDVLLVRARLKPPQL